MVKEWETAVHFGTYFIKCEKSFNLAKILVHFQTLNYFCVDLVSEKETEVQT